MRKAIDRSFLSWLLQTTGPSLTLMKGRGRGSCGNRDCPRLPVPQHQVGRAGLK
jgi:hypothetical protein